MSGVVVCTGADQDYFLMACLLMRALRNRAPQLSFCVLDFGLTERQRRFLKRQAILLDRPHKLAPNQDPWRYKAAMGSYLAPLEWSAAVWLDTDTIPVGPIGAGLDGLLAEMKSTGNHVAACRDGVGTVGDLAKKFDVSPFTDILRADGVPLSVPYYNSGVVVCRSPEFLHRWDTLVQTLPDHPVFEQNGFNILLHRHGEPKELPAEVWNLHGPKLAEAKVNADGEVRVPGHDPALIVHLTSSRAKDISLRSEIKIGRQHVNTYMRWFGNSALRSLQLAGLAQFFLEMWDEFHQLGLVADAASTASQIQAAGLSPSAALLFREALVLQANDRWSEADAQLAKLEQFHPANPDVICQRAHGWWRQGLLSAAVELAQRALQSNAQHVRANMILGLARAQLGAFTEAIIRFNQVIAAVPQSHDAYVAKAHALAALGSFEAALAASTEATLLAPDSFGAWRAHTAVLEALGNADQAREARNSAVALIST